MKRTWIYLAALAWLLCCTGCSGEGTASQSTSGGLAAEAASLSESSVASEEAAEPEVREPEYCTWPGFLDKTVTEDNHTLTLSNDEGNTVTLSFVITEDKTGAVLYESGTVAPGESALWDIYEAYTTGSHTVTITTTADTGNRLAQQIVLTLPEEGE
ncbi:MAG: hypothetical protein LUG55_10710 [Clostridiales bacterium]|nr:hypothetical protein [Clostridiales bacterium]